jgi:methionyl-tRNA formyltransferase
MSDNRLPPSALRLLMMGTGPFAVPTFRALLASPHEVLALVTRPDRPQHRREKAPTNPMREVAHERSLEVFEPESINSAEANAWLKDRHADLFVVCDYGQILSRDTLSLARLGGINLHASLLPKYRGAAPINWAIYHGETETGVTVIHMTPQLDAGPALVQLATPIGPDETTPELETRLSQLGVQAVLDAIDLLIRGEAGNAPLQDPKLATKAPRLKKDDGLIDWSRPAAAIALQVRAFQPWPKSHTLWNRGKGEPVRLILEKVAVVDRESASPGTVLEAAGNHLVVACGERALQIELIQPAGKKPLRAEEFLRGYPLKPGDQIG